jgi:Xaa-Pro dipeptidase
MKPYLARRIAALQSEMVGAGMILDQIGHGVGIRQSEFFPVVGKGLTHVIAKNMVVDLLLPTVFKPGVGGPRITDMIRVAESGGIFMTTFSRDLIDREHRV